MKYVCAMCGKEEEVTGCLGRTSFQHGSSLMEGTLRSEGLSTSDFFCKHCYERLRKKAQAQTGLHF